MEIVDFIAFVLVPIALLGGAVVWAFGRKRKKRFEDDALRSGNSRRIWVARPQRCECRAVVKREADRRCRSTGRPKSSRQRCREVA